MKLCRTCGAPMDDEETFCPMCGAKFEEGVIEPDVEETSVLVDDELVGEDTQYLNPKENDETRVLDESVNDISKNNTLTVQAKKKRLSQKALVGIIIGALVIIIVALVTIILFLNNDAPNDDYYDYDIGYYDYDYEESNEAENNIVSGRCGDNAEFTIINDSLDPNAPYYVLTIDGEGALWADEEIDWKIDGGKVNEIFIADGITHIQPFQFSYGKFDSVKTIVFSSSVEFIGECACRIDSLECIYVYNPNCEIDYIWYDDEFEKTYLNDTLGYPNKSVTIMCSEGSTAEQYVNDWNDYNNDIAYDIEYAF